MSDTTSGAAVPAERRLDRSDKRGGAGSGNVFARLGLWFRQILAELRKVIWPTRKELVTYTTVTLIFAAVMILIVAGLDYGANWLVLKIFG